MNPDQELFSVKLLNLQNVCLVCKLGPKPYLHNSSDAEVTLPKGTFLLGFGKGKFKMAGQHDKEINVDTMPLYHLCTSSDIVSYGKETQMLKCVVDARRKDDPLAKVAYHHMEDIDGEEHELGAFKLTLVNKVYFAAEGVMMPHENGGEESAVDQKNKLSYSTAGCLVHMKFWKTPATEVIFQTKWAVNGLTPVRPQVVTSVEIVIPPGKCVELF